MHNANQNRDQFNIAVLGSTNGTNLHPLQHALIKQQCNARIQLVITNLRSAGIIRQAKLIKIPSMIIPHHDFTRLQHEYRIHQALKAANIDFIILLGYMRILTSFIIHKWPHKIMNVHPSLLPKYKGLMDLSVHQAVIEANEKESGCSVHYVTEALDDGQIIAQKKCIIPTGTTAIQLKNIIQPLEVDALTESITQLIKKITTYEFIS